MTPATHDRPLRVLLVSPAGEGGNGGIDRMMDALCGALAGNRAVVTTRLVSRGPNLASSLWFLPLALLRIAMAGLLRQADVVHINLSSYGSSYRKALIATACRLCGLPYTVHLHGSQFRAFWEECGSLRRTMIAAMFEGAARVLVLGEVWADFLRKAVPGATPRIAIVPNATAPRPDPVPATVDGPVRILFIGRLGARKGVPELTAALAALKDVPGWHAIIAGDGETVKTAEAMAACGIADRVSVPGWMGPQETEALLSQADVLALPSHAENLPMSVIEGMAHALAVVTTPVGATEDIIHDGETGILVPPGDVAALRDALRRTIEDRALRQRLGDNARAFQQAHLSLPGYAARMVEIWRAASQDAPCEPVCRPVSKSPL